MQRDFNYGVGALLLAVAIVGLLVASNIDVTNAAAKDIFFVAMAVLPAILGAVLFLIGAAEWYTERRALRHQRHHD